jgi:ubiquinone/menaquinone biosynthesis C-methylase UbiE
MISTSSPFGYGHASEVQRLLIEASEDEMEFNLQGGDKLRTSWMPFQIADFVAIMCEVMKETNGVGFLEVGSGIGTKSLIAKNMFGLMVAGIEYNESLATVSAQKYRVTPWVGDALHYPYGYSNYDIIWMYRCFRDPVLQEQLEQRIYREAKSGAIFAGAGLEHVPEGWSIVVDDIDIGNRGAWKKP